MPKKKESPEHETNHLPRIEFRGRIYFKNDFEGCAMICEEIIRRIEKTSEEIVPIGFDIEWPVIYAPGTTSLTNKTALAQLCLSPRTCHLFHIYNIRHLPLAFIQLLGHPKIRLVGVNVRQDIQKLGRDFPGFPAAEIVKNNCIECGKFMNDNFFTQQRWSLAALTAHLLEKRLDKSDAVRKSKWYKLPLTEAQQTYAATDAYASLLVYLNMRSRIAD